MIMLSDQLLDMPPLAGGSIILAQEKCSPTGRQTNLCKTFEQNKLFVHMEHFWDLLFQLNNLHVAFIFLSRVVEKLLIS
jgi:hypothetical protein